MNVVDPDMHNMIGGCEGREKKRRRSDLNRRITVLQTVALGHLATPP